MIRLILGGERSGKSGHAEELFLADPGPHRFVATGSPVDMQFRQQIREHQTIRPPEIAVTECTHDLPAVLAAMFKENPGMSILVDSLDFWYFHCCNRASALGDARLADMMATELADVLSRAGRARVTLVSCEIGLGPVPASSETRRFVRGLGAVHQQVARMADQVQLVVAGCPLPVKGV